MPAAQRGQVDKIERGKWRLRWYAADGKRHSKQPFPSKSAAWHFYREHVEPQFSGPPKPADLTLSEFVPIFLERHAVGVRSRTIATLKERLRHAERSFGSIRLRELENMAGELAGWVATQPERIAHGRMSALRQCLAAGVRWNYMTRNPAVDAGRNRKPPPRRVRVFTFEELDRIAVELPPMYQALPQFAAATGLRPEEWQALEGKDIDRKAGSRANGLKPRGGGAGQDFAQPPTGPAKSQGSRCAG